MDIRYLHQQEKERSRELWEQCFPEDSARFLDYYYQEKCRDNQILVLEGERGEILSMAHQNPYRIVMPAGEYVLDYIVGVATDEKCRHQGYMRRLLTRMLSEQKARKNPFTFLMPASWKIYAPFGFDWIFDQPDFQLNSLGKGLESYPAADSPREREEVREWLGQWLSRRYQIYALRDAAYLDCQKKEIDSEYGEIFLLRDSASRLRGMECFWGKEERERRFLYAEEPYLAANPSAKPAIMARILDLPEFMKSIRLKKRADGEKQDPVEFIINLSDPVLEENNGCFLVTVEENGSRISLLGGSREMVPSLSIGALTQWLMGYGRAPKELTEEAEKIQTCGKIFLDEVV